MIATDIGLLDYNWPTSVGSSTYELRGMLYRWPSLRGMRLQSDAQWDDNTKTARSAWRLIAEERGSSSRPSPASRIGSRSPRWSTSHAPASARWTVEAAIPMRSRAALPARGIPAASLMALGACSPSASDVPSLSPSASVPAPSESAVAACDPGAICTGPLPPATTGRRRRGSGRVHPGRARLVRTGRHSRRRLQHLPGRYRRTRDQRRLVQRRDLRGRLLSRRHDDRRDHPAEFMAFLAERHGLGGRPRRSRSAGDQHSRWTSPSQWSIRAPRPAPGGSGSGRCQSMGISTSTMRSGPASSRLTGQRDGDHRGGGFP